MFFFPSRKAIILNNKRAAHREVFCSEEREREKERKKERKKEKERALKSRKKRQRNTSGSRFQENL